MRRLSEYDILESEPNLECVQSACAALQGGEPMFLEILKAILMGIVEGITEWLPICPPRPHDPGGAGGQVQRQRGIHVHVPRGHPAGCHSGCGGAVLEQTLALRPAPGAAFVPKPAVWQLWFKVVAATIPVLIISPLDDWFENRFYNYITVAAMLILYGVLFYPCGEPPHRPCMSTGWNRSPTAKPSSLACGRCWPSSPAPPARCHHRGRPAAGSVPCLCG